jgi:hypothetical protein
MYGFDLQKHHIKNGALVGEDFSSYAGYDVRVFQLADFPNWPQVQSGQKLTPEQLFERSAAIYKALYPSASLTAPDIYYGEEKPSHFNIEETDGLARHTFSTIQFDTQILDDFDLNAGNHFQLTLRHGIDHPSTLIRLPYDAGVGAGRLVVFPYTYDEAVPIRNIKYNTAAVLLQENDSFTNYLSRSSGLPSDRIKKMSDDGSHRLAIDLHEMRHLRQLQANSSVAIPEFYSEVDADLFAHDTLKSNGIGKQYRTTDRHIRYLRMLSIIPRYWIAPTLDHLEAKSAPPSFFKLFDSVMEIRTRLIMQAQQEPHTCISSSILQNAIANYDGRFPSPDRNDELTKKVGECDQVINDWVKTDLGQRPEIPFTIMRHLVKMEAFDDPLTRFIAQKIVAAAEHLNPALTRESSPYKKLCLPEPRRPTDYNERDLLQYVPNA